MAIQSDGKIVVAGSSGHYPSSDFVLVRYDPNGSLDTSFGGTGRIIIPMPYSESHARSVAIQSDGKIVAVGYTRSGNLVSSDYVVVRLNRNGSPDTTFHGTGIVITPFCCQSYAIAVAIQADGKIVVAGGTDDILYDFVDFVVVRYQGDPPPSLHANGKIAFTSNRDGNREIYVMNADGTNQTRVTNNSIVDDHPTWSPDGKTIAFVSERASGGRAIFTMNPDGTDRTEVTAVSYVDRYADWPSAIWTDFYSMDWSPDGTQIVFQDNYDIVIVKTDGSNRHAITDGTSRDFEPAWSPNGSKILFSRDIIGDPSEYGRLSSVNIDGSNIQYLPNGWQSQAYAPKWAPSGDKILYVIEFTDDIPDSVINISNSDGSDPQLFDGNSPGFEYRNKPTWSPDGTKILFDKWVYAGFPGDLEIYLKNTNGTGFIQLTDTNGWNFNPSWQPLASTSAPFDFDGDGRTDISVFRPSDRVWYLNRSTDGFFATQFGLLTDNITPSDFDGDGKTDIAVFRPSDQKWYIANSSDGSSRTEVFGLAQDLPAPADYDGDGKADLCVFRPSDGTWYLQRSSDGSYLAYQFGSASDKPTVGDFDGDGLSDFAVFRTTNGEWYQSYSSDGSIHGEQFGFSTDKLAYADYDGDGETDLAVFRPSDRIFYIRNSATATYSAFVFGLSDDIPTPGDYDGDGKADLSVFRPSDGNWYRQNSGNGSYFAYQFGLNGDRPTPTAYH